jgi:phospholipid transport system substrate-binding protein
MFVLGTTVASFAASNSAVEDFVRTGVDTGFAILNNHGISDDERRAKFRKFLLSLTDVRRIALFTLGPNRRAATGAELDQFVDAFRDYAVAVYEAKLSAYSGQTLKVTGSIERAPGDFVVTTVLADRAERVENHAKPIQVDFRVALQNGRFVVIDLSILGIWLAIEERDQFASFLEHNSGGIPVLVEHLQALTAQLRARGNK